jgi:hypothetical protein
MDTDLSLSEWARVMAPPMDAAVRLLGFKDFNHFMQVREMVALANAKRKPPPG